MGQKLAEERSLFTSIPGRQGGVADLTDLAKHLQGHGTSFRDSYNALHPAGDIVTLPYPVWHVSDDHVVYDPKMSDKNILFHMTHEIIVPFLIPVLERRELEGDDTQVAILEMVYGDELSTYLGHIQELTRSRQPR
jgi:hypothetical protein